MLVLIRRSRPLLSLLQSPVLSRVHAPSPAAVLAVRGSARCITYRNMSGKTSKTIVLTGYGGYYKLKIEDRPVAAPGKGQVVVNVKASGINFAELMSRQGTYDRTPKVPAVLGLECSGVIVELGDGVSTFKVSFVAYFLSLIL